MSPQKRQQETSNSVVIVNIPIDFECVTGAKQKCRGTRGHASVGNRVCNKGTLDDTGDKM